MSDLELMKIHERSIGREEGKEEGEARGVLMAARKIYSSLMEQAMPLDVVRKTVKDLGISEEDLCSIEEEYSREMKGSAPSRSVARMNLE